MAGTTNMALRKPRMAAVAVAERGLSGATLRPMEIPVLVGLEEHVQRSLREDPSRHLQSDPHLSGVMRVVVINPHVVLFTPEFEAPLHPLVLHDPLRRAHGRCRR